jgi:exopolysaccharide biosynthesis WecB/TagA/CpsF family protein
MNNKKRLIYIIVSYNSDRDIEKSTRSASSFCKNNDIVVVVDNASQDGTLSILNSLSEELNNVIIHSLDVNVGFGNAHNIVFESYNADWFFLLNVDAWLTKSSVERVIDDINNDDSIAICGLPLVFPTGAPQTFAYPFSSPLKWVVQLLGGRWVIQKLINLEYFNILSNKTSLLRNYSNSQRRGYLTESSTIDDFDEKIEDVDWVCGASMLIRGDFIESFGGFDPKIFLYGEDEDICIKAHNNSKRVVKFNVYPVTHIFGWGENKFNRTVAKLKYDSLNYFIKKNVNSFTKRRAMLFLLPFHVYGFRRIFIPLLDEENYISLIDNINSVFEQPELEKTTLEIFTNKGVTLVCFVNAHAINMALSNLDFYNTLKNSDFLFRDGVGIELMFKMLGRNPGFNLNGTDYIPKVINCAIDKGFDIALIGTEEPHNINAGDAISNLGGKVIYIDHGFHEVQYYLETLKSKINHDTVVILGMGMPKQELVASTVKNEIKCIEHSVVIVCGGAVIDFIGGKVKRAPKIFREYKLEWLYRLLQEPRRMFKRYVLGNFRFLIKAVKVYFSSKFTHKV